MNLKHYTLILLIALVSVSASAQTMIPLGKKTDRRGSNAGSLLNSSEREKMLGTVIDAETVILEKDKYTDERLKEMQDKMHEREWGTEATAWERASLLDNIESYKKYCAIYPYGEHRGEANKRMVDLEVNDILNHSHNDMPELKRIVKEDDSPQSTIYINNNTVYPMTVLYSGAESKKIVISAGSKGVIKITNGLYKIACSVPDRKIRPYAGQARLQGGVYETGYYVVSL